MDREYADDQIVVAESCSELQAMVNDAVVIAGRFGLRLNASKCKAMIIGRPATVGDPSTHPCISIDGVQLKWSDEIKNALNTKKKKNHFDDTRLRKLQIASAKMK